MRTKIDERLQELKNMCDGETIELTPTLYYEYTLLKSIERGYDDIDDIKNLLLGISKASNVILETLSQYIEINNLSARTPCSNSLSVGIIYIKFPDVFQAASFREHIHNRGYLGVVRQNRSVIIPITPKDLEEYDVNSEEEKIEMFESAVSINLEDWLNEFGIENKTEMNLVKHNK